MVCCQIRWRFCWPFWPDCQCLLRREALVPNLRVENLSKVHYSMLVGDISKRSQGVWKTSQNSSDPRRTSRLSNTLIVTVWGLRELDYEHRSQPLKLISWRTLKIRQKMNPISNRTRIGRTWRKFGKSRQRTLPTQHGTDNKPCVTHQNETGKLVINDPS